MAVTALLFASLYSSLHRLWVPLVLHWTVLSRSPFARIDWIFLGGLALWWNLSHRKRLFPLSSSIAGYLVGFGLAEGIRIASGHYEGWLALSHGLSSIPMSLAAFALLLHRESNGRYLWAWTGALIAIIPLSGDVFAPTSVARPAPTASARTPNQPVASPETLLLTQIHSTCGAQAFSFVLSGNESEKSELTVENCGLRPPIIPHLGGRMPLNNVTNRSMNLHFVFFENGVRKMGWNLVLRPRTKLLSPEFHLKRDAVGLLYSDNTPEAGLSLVFSPSRSAPELIEVSRRELSLKRGAP